MEVLLVCVMVGLQRLSDFLDHVEGSGEAGWQAVILIDGTFLVWYCIDLVA